MGKEFLDSLDHPRRSGILALIEVQCWGTLLGHPANRLVRPNGRNEQNRDRVGQIESLLQSPERQGGHRAIHRFHQDIEED